MIAALLSSSFSEFPGAAAEFTIDCDGLSQHAVTVLVPLKEIKPTRT
jgi:hypothetical protein